MSENIVLAGSASEKLGGSVSKLTNSEFYNLDSKIFPDNEVYVRIPTEVKEKRVFIIQTMQSPKFNPNELLLEFLFASKTLDELEAKEVIGIIPYLAYSRQDKRFKEGEAISSEIIANVIKSLGVSKVFCFDSHVNRTIPLNKLFGMEAYDLSGFSEIGNYYSNNFELRDPLVLAPDFGSKDLAEALASKINCESDYLKKKRIDGENVVTEEKDINTKGRDIIIVDDIISTGGTIVNAVEMIKKANPNRIFVSAIHGLFVGGADSKIVDAGADEIIVTNSVESNYSQVDLAPILKKEAFGI